MLIPPLCVCKWDVQASSGMLAHVRQRHDWLPLAQPCKALQNQIDGIVKQMRKERLSIKSKTSLDWLGSGQTSMRPDVLDVNGLLQVDAVPAGSLIQTEFQGVCWPFRLVRRQNQQAPMITILINPLHAHRT